MRKLLSCDSAISEASGAEAAVKLQDGDRLRFGERYVECRATPGHTDGCMSFLTDDGSMIFTGDALLIRGCGRTDFQRELGFCSFGGRVIGPIDHPLTCTRTHARTEGSADNMFNSIHTKIFSLPAEVLVYPGAFLGPCVSKRAIDRVGGKTHYKPSQYTHAISRPAAHYLGKSGHDYRGRLFTTVGEEKKYNARLAGKTRQQFVEIMQNLKLGPSCGMQASCLPCLLPAWPSHSLNPSHRHALQTTPRRST